MTMRFNLSTLIFIFLFGIIISTSYAAETNNFDWRMVPQKTIKMEVPKCWEKKVMPPKNSDDEQYGIIVFKDQCNNDNPPNILRIQVTNLSEDLSNADSLRHFIKKTGQLLLPRAVETKVTVNSFSSQDVKGFYYTLTDRAVKPGEYLYITQGGINLDNDLLLFFTFLYNKDDKVTMHDLISALKSIQLVELKSEKSSKEQNQNSE